MKVELHLLQSVPPSNLNRDDTGAPKDAHFGGHRRARLSSQSLKRAIRTSEIFKQIVSNRVGIRTRRAAPYITEILEKKYGLDHAVARALAEAGVELLNNKKLKKEKSLDGDGYSSVLYFGTYPEFDDLARRLSKIRDDVLPEITAYANALAALEDIGADEDKTEKVRNKAAGELAKRRRELAKKVKKPVVDAFIKEQKGKTSAADIALFGRMLAEEPTLNIDAACQVAHALSVDRVAPSFDYFTAVDDLKQADDEENLGASMIGTTGFTSACFYRYAVIDVNQLVKNLGGDIEAARDAIRAFLTAAVCVLPSGKQNSFAAQVRPEFVMAVVRHDGMPLSLVNAFAAPVRPGTHSLAYHAVEALNQEWINMETMFAGLLPNGREPNVFVATPHVNALKQVNEDNDEDRDQTQYTLASHVVSSVKAVIEGVDKAIAQQQGENA